MQKVSPLSRAVREFIFVLSGTAVFVSVLGAMRAGDIATVKANLIPLAVAALAALIAAFGTYLLALWAKYQALVNTPLERAISTAVKFFVAQLVAIQVVSIDPQVLLSIGQNMWTALAQAITAGIAVLIVNAVEGTPPVPVELVARNEATPPQP